MYLEAEKKGVGFAVAFPSDLRREVIGDSIRLRQVLLNLSSNAIKFTEQGEILIEVTKLQEDSHNIRIGVTVNDTGIGISREFLGELFQPFTQERRRYTKQIGTGLGLSISRKIVEMFDGSITVESTNGQGSTFRFDALLTKPDHSSPDLMPLALSPGSGAKVVLLGQAAFQWQGLTRKLEAWGFTVTPSPTPERVIEEINQGKASGAPVAMVLVVDKNAPGDETPPPSTETKDMETLWPLVADHGQDIPLALLVSPLALSTLEKKQGFRPGDMILTHPLTFDSLMQVVHPQAVPSPRPTPPPAPDNQGKTGFETSPTNQNSFRILLVEDEEINRALACTILKKQGFQFEIATNGLQAVNQAKSQDFGLILMDIMMPEMDGYQATEAIRNMPGDKGKTPIIALTASAMKKDVDKFSEAGFDDYMTKPIEVESFIEMVEQWATRHKETLV